VADEQRELTPARQIPDAQRRVVRGRDGTPVPC
jgi:hypothetical protein